jgi:disulfide bond formation protein DsbB
MAMSKKEALNALLKEEEKEGRPSWRYRRRLIFGSFYLAVFMILFAAGTFFVDSRVSSELVIGGVSLISIILTAYIAGATIEDINLWNKPQDEPLDTDEFH